MKKILRLYKINENLHDLIIFLLKDNLQFCLEVPIANAELYLEIVIANVEQVQG